MTGNVKTFIFIGKWIKNDFILSIEILKIKKKA